MDDVTITPTLQVDAERQVKAKALARINRRLMVVDLLVSAVYFIAWLVLGWSQALAARLTQITANPWLLTALYVIIVGGILFIINLPLSFYQGFSLPHAFGLSTQTVRGWIMDQVKGILLGGILGLVLLELIYAILRAYPTQWWLWAAGLMLIFNVLLANIAPTVIMPLFNKFVPLEAEHADLSERLLKLAERSGTRVIGVFKFDLSRRTVQANAALTGLGNTRRIILGDTLLKEFSAEEIETVLAHELGHQVNRDIPLGIVFGTVTTTLGFFLASLGLSWGVKAFNFSAPGDIAAFPLLLIVLGLYGLVTMPLENGFSRWREARADRYALELTHNGPAFASALRRLANQNLSDADPEAWVEWLLYSHPALGKRIAAAERIK